MSAGARAGRWPSWLAAYLARYKRQVALALALGLLASACAALLMFTSGYLISATAVAGTALFSVMMPVACVQLFGIGRPLARWAERLASHDWVLRVTSDLRLALYRGIEARTGDPARERAAGEYLGLLADDVAHLQNLYLRVVFPTAVAYALALLAAVPFGIFSVPFALLMLASLAAIAVLVPLGSLLAVRAPIVEGKRSKAAESVALVDDVGGSVDWVLSGRSAEACRRHAEADAHVRSLGAAARMRTRTASLASALLLGALLCAVVMWAGGALGASSATANWIAAFALGFFPLIESLSVLPAAFAESAEHRESVGRLDGYLGEGATPSPTLPAAPQGEAAIELDDVTYSYPGARKPALDGLTLAVPRGQRLAVLGRSGSGKSTLAKLVCAALQPCSGEVRVEGRVGYLGQDPHLFNRTLRENLKVGAPDASDEQLAAILESVGLGRKLAQLPDGLDTVVGETGVGFSGGEAHRVALARVLAADTPVVLVDEPFAALDPETESALLDTLFAACAGKTLVVVTHHLAEIERFDRVVFIEDARLDLDGSPAALLASSERFRTLVSFDRA